MRKLPLSLAPMLAIGCAASSRHDHAPRAPRDTAGPALTASARPGPPAPGPAPTESLAKTHSSVGATRKASSPSAEREVLMVNAILAAGKARGDSETVIQALVGAVDLMHARAQWSAAAALGGALFAATNRRSIALSTARSELMVAATARDPARARAACARAYDLFDRKAPMAEVDGDPAVLAQRTSSFHAVGAAICRE